MSLDRIVVAGGGMGGLLGERVIMADLVVDATTEVTLPPDVSTDGAYFGAELIGVEPPTDEDKAAGALLSQVATEDPEVALAAKRYAHFFDGQALAAPGIADRVAAWKEQGRRVVNNDPTVIQGLLS